MQGVESYLVEGVSALRLAVETVGALVVGVGVGGLLFRWARGCLGSAPRVDFRSARLHLSQYLAMALELQLAGDILATAIAPSWAELGRLAAIAAIRTFLNYFLEREMKALDVPREVDPALPERRPAEPVDGPAPSGA